MNDSNQRDTKNKTNTGKKPQDQPTGNKDNNQNEITVEVIRSTKRKKTIEASFRDGVMVVKIPHRMSKKDEKRVVEEMKERLLKKRERKTMGGDEALEERAESLNQKYLEGKVRFSSIRFVSNQTRRFGSCSILSGDIRISDRLKSMPTWVLDYVIMHELTHLIHADHSADFWQVVNRYPLTERARGYLIAVSLSEDEDEHQA